MPLVPKGAKISGPTTPLKLCLEAEYSPLSELKTRHGYGHDVQSLRAGSNTRNFLARSPVPSPELSPEV